MSAAYRFDSERLLADLTWRLAIRDMTWKDLGQETGIGDSAFTRLRRGGNPDAHNLVTLLKWLDKVDCLTEYIWEP